MSRLAIALHGEHFGHAVGNRRAGGKHDSAAVVHGLNMSELSKHIEGAFGWRLRQTGDARHLGNIKQVFEIMRLVHEKSVNAEFLKGQRVVFFVGGGKQIRVWPPDVFWLFPVPSPSAGCPGWRAPV
jgi:hypothetical protein